MEPRAHHVLIGLFTFIAACAMLVFALWLAKTHKEGQVSSYRIIFNEPVRGLSRGSPVLYNGIRVGEIEELHLNVSDLREAHAHVSIDANIPIRIDTQARQVMTGITGASVIELTGGSPLSPVLIAGRHEEDPTIIAVPSPLSQLLSGGDSLLESVSELVMNVNRLFSSENIDRTHSILENIDELTHALSGQTKDLGDVLEGAGRISRGVNKTLAKTQELITSAGTLLDDQGKAVLAHAEQAMKSLSAASADLRQILSDTKDDTVSGLQGFNELGPALQALRQTLVTFQDMLRRLDDNPRGYLFGGDKIEEFEP